MSEPDKKETRGRPAHEFSDLELEQVKRLAEIQCTVKEIAHVMGCSTDTIKRKYMDTVHAGQSEGKIKLRRAQWRNAIEENNTTMQIWLGKNMLGQSDNPVDEDSNQILPWSD